MNEADVALAIIFVLGLYGMVCESWSPHPPLMALVGGLYLCLRFAAYILVTVYKRFKGGNYGKH